jgi:hypothetical protein
MSGNKNSGRNKYKDEGDLMEAKRIWHKRRVWRALKSTNVHEMVKKVIDDMYRKKTGLEP